MSYKPGDYLKTQQQDESLEVKEILDLNLAEKYKRRNPTNSNALQLILLIEDMVPGLDVKDIRVLLQNDQDTLDKIDTTFNSLYYKNDHRLSFHQTRDYGYASELYALKPTSSALFRYFESAQSQEGYVMLNREFIETEMGLSRNTVSAGIKELIHYGIIEEVGKHKNSKIYRVNQDISKKNKGGFPKSTPKHKSFYYHVETIHTSDKPIRVGSLQPVFKKNTSEPKTTSNSSDAKTNPNPNDTLNMTDFQEDIALPFEVDDYE